MIKPWGFLSVTNLCYIKTPPDQIVNQVSDILGVKIVPWGEKQWKDLFQNSNLFESYYGETVSLESQSIERLETYVSYFLEKDHIRILGEDVKQAIYDRWLLTLKIFNSNHKYLGFMLNIFRKRFRVEEPELFIEGNRQ